MIISSSDLRSMTRGQWRVILLSAGVRESCLTNRHGPCPVCGGQDRFRWDDKDGAGSYFCNQQCGAGDGFKLLMLFRGWNFKQARDFVEQNIMRIGRKADEVSSRDNFNPEQRRAQIEKILSGSKAIRPGDPVALYLENRGLQFATFPEDLLYHQNLAYFDCNHQFIGAFPAMVARVRDAQDLVVGLHRTYLTETGQKAFSGSDSKKALALVPGSLKGAAVKLFSPEQELGLAEGIETALACAEATGIPTWSALAAGFLSKVVVPSSVRELVIFGDLDKSGAGQKAANEAADRFVQQGLKVKIVLPPNQDEDWLDVCTKE